MPTVCFTVAAVDFLTARSSRRGRHAGGIVRRHGARPHVWSGGTADVFGRITRSAMVASSGTLIVLSGGVVSGAVISKGGTETVSKRNGAVVVFPGGGCLRHPYSAGSTRRERLVRP